jgi:hypothetical protein
VADRGDPIASIGLTRGGRLFAIGVALVVAGGGLIVAATTARGDIAGGLALAGVTAVVTACALRWRVDLFADRVAIGAWFGRPRVIALDQIDEAYIERRSTGDGSSVRLLYLKTGGREVAITASRLVGWRQRENFAAALSRAVLERRLSQFGY